jgi:transposase-like protein
MKDQKLTPKQEQAALYIEYGLKFNSIAKELGTNERTIYRWLDREDFRQYIDKEKSKRREYAKEILKNSFSKAVQKIRNLLSDNNSNVSLKAALSIIDLNLKLVEIEENEEKLRHLEEELNENHQEQN